MGFSQGHAGAGVSPGPLPGPCGCGGVLRCVGHPRVRGPRGAAPGAARLWGSPSPRAVSPGGRGGGAGAPTAAQGRTPMASVAARARVLRALRRPLPPGRLPLSARRYLSDAEGSVSLPPGGYGVWQERAARDPAGFWAEVARGVLRWDSPFHTACEVGQPAAARWFLGGRLNVSGKASSSVLPPPRASPAALRARPAGGCPLLPSRPAEGLPTGVVFTSAPLLREKPRSLAERRWERVRWVLRSALGKRG